MSRPLESVVPHPLTTRAISVWPLAPLRLAGHEGGARETAARLELYSHNMHWMMVTKYTGFCSTLATLY